MWGLAEAGVLKELAHARTSTMHPLRFLGKADQSAKSAQSGLIVLLSDCHL